jgi:hypothetical protein
MEMDENKKKVKVLMGINQIRNELSALNKLRESLKVKCEDNINNENLVLVKYLEYKYKQLEERSINLLNESNALNDRGNLSGKNYNK